MSKTNFRGLKRCLSYWSLIVYNFRYFEGGVSSVYLWDLDHGFAGVILIKKAGDGSQKIKGCWDSIHVIEVQVSHVYHCLIYLLSYLPWPLSHVNAFVCVEVYGPIYPMGSCWGRSVDVTTLLLDRLSPLLNRLTTCNMPFSLFIMCLQPCHAE